MNKKLNECRIEAIGRIRYMLQLAPQNRVEVSELCDSSSPITHESCDDDDFTYTVDRIYIDEKGHIVVDSSNCESNRSEYATKLSTDSLEEIADWLEEIEDEIRELAEE